MPFDSLGLSPALLRAVRARAYTAPTPIQMAAIPAALAGRDVLGAAQTGSGKTLAYALPLLQRAEETPSTHPRLTRALVLVPTRELAAQVGDELVALTKSLDRPLKISTIFGGVSINPQMMALRGGADLAVATPGRLLDLMERGAIKLDDVETLVLDEADRLLDLGFAEELARILELLPERHQSLLFSATFPAAVQALVKQVLHDPLCIDIPNEPETGPDIAQRAISVDPDRRTQLLRHLLERHRWPRVLVFVATKHGAEHVADKLRRADIVAEAFHGELSQGKRTEVLASFKASRVTVVVATDVAARGLDIVQLPVVVNYDLPRSAADYVHRIGRTGRAGESGLAVSFVSAGTDAHFRLIERVATSAIPRETVEGFEPRESVPPKTAALTDGTGGIKSHRPSKKDKLRAAESAPLPDEGEGEAEAEADASA